jgi:NAD(P)-dependent dehydrogenase (short-subunit alcohol dehydrogenase family)
MKTDLIIDLLAKEGKHIEDNWVKDVPMGRLGQPSELQGTIVWMASDASSYLNGSDIVSPTLDFISICFQAQWLLTEGLGR